MSKKMTNVNEIPETLKAYLGTIEDYPQLSSEKTRELALRKDHDPEARDLLIKSNLRLVLYVVNQTNRKGMDYMDLVMAGNEGLIKGVDKYDPVHFDTELSTCAIRWIENEVGRAVANQHRMIRIPIETGRDVDKVAIFRNRYFQEHEEYPDNETVAKALNLPLKKIPDLIRWSTPVSSTDDKVVSDDGDSKSRIDSISEHDEDKSSNQGPQSDAFASLLDSMILEQALTVLTPREKLVITYRFGLYGVKARTLKEVAAKLSLSREAIRQIETRALKKLRRELEDRA